MLAKKTPLVIVVGKRKVTVPGNASETVFPDNSVQGTFLIALNSQQNWRKLNPMFAMTTCFIFPPPENPARQNLQEI